MGPVSRSKTIVKPTCSPSDAHHVDATTATLGTTSLVLKVKGWLNLAVKTCKFTLTVSLSTRHKLWHGTPLTFHVPLQSCKCCSYVHCGLHALY